MGSYSVVSKATLAQMVNDGMSQESIGRELHLHPKTVSRIGKRLGVKFHHGRRNTYRRLQVIQAVQAGCRNSSEIGQVIGVNRIQAHRYVRELCNQGLLRLTGRSSNTRIVVTSKWEANRGKLA